MFARLSRGLLINAGEIRSAVFFARSAVFTLGPAGLEFEVKRNGADRLRELLRRRGLP